MLATIYQDVSATLAAMSPWELIAVLLSVVYLALIMRHNRLGWYAALGSTSIFIWLFWDASLLMESALNVYYLLMAVYGWWAWRGGLAYQPLPIQRLPLVWHVGIIALVLILTAASGYWLSQYTYAALPYLDSFTTWGAVVTTWLVARKVLENWYYWLVIDSAALYLYVQRDLYLTALLMVVYLVMIVVGWLKWRADYQAQQAQAV